jgi:hypothetical protein
VVAEVTMAGTTVVAIVVAEVTMAEMAVVAPIEALVVAPIDYSCFYPLYLTK